MNLAKKGEMNFTENNVDMLSRSSRRIMEFYNYHLLHVIF